MMTLNVAMNVNGGRINLVARPDAERAQARIERAGAAVRGDAALDPGAGREGLLERPHLFAAIAVHFPGCAMPRAAICPRPRRTRATSASQRCEWAMPPRIAGFAAVPAWEGGSVRPTPAAVVEARNCRRLIGRCS